MHYFADGRITSRVVQFIGSASDINPRLAIWTEYCLHGWPGSRRYRRSVADRCDTVPGQETMTIAGDSGSRNSAAATRVRIEISPTGNDA